MGIFLPAYTVAITASAKVSVVPSSRSPARGTANSRLKKGCTNCSWLTRTTDEASRWDSLLPLPKPYVVPGGRFREVYYWDSYFTMLGLAESGHWDKISDMVANFAWEIDSWGHIPNGNRSYYLSRSQPPFFAFMVELLASDKGDEVLKTYLPQLEKEYQYWMDGADRLQNGQANKRVVKLDDGSVLNRYWDDKDTPRPESWLDDVTTAKNNPNRPATESTTTMSTALERTSMSAISSACSPVSGCDR